MFLTQEDIRELTGFAYNAHQIKWLAEHGYKFEVNRAGIPKVLKSYLEERLGGGLAQKSKHVAKLNLSDSKYFG